MSETNKDIAVAFYKKALFEGRLWFNGRTVFGGSRSAGRFVKLVPNEQIVEVDEFETTDPALRGEIRSTITLTDADGGTDILAVHEGLPSGVSPADNEIGWRMALEKLAAFVETGDF